MPRTPEEEQAFKEAVDRHNSHFGYAVHYNVHSGYVRKKSTPPQPPKKVVKKDWSVTICGKTTRSSESAPENIRIILEAEAAAAEQARQRIARLLQELGTSR